MARELAIENGKLKSNLDANGNKVANLAPPTSDGDAATKKYVDERPFPTPSWSDIAGKPDTFPPEAHTHTKSEITDFPASMPPTAHSHASDSWFTSALSDKLDKTYGTATDLTVIEPLTIQASTGGNSAMFSVGTDDGVLYISGPSDLNFGSSTRTLNQIDDKLNELDDGKANASDFTPSTPASYVTNFVQKSVRYQTHAIGSDGAVVNFAFNTLTMTGDKTLAFPTVAAGDPPRDFILVVTYTSGSLTLPSGFTYYGDAVSMEANATYLFAFTEVKSGEFYRRVIKMEVPNA